jgi:Flp pilus assembly protein TadG
MREVNQNRYKPARPRAKGIRRCAAEERGSALVEMAVTLPILLLLVTGLATFGIAFGNYLSLTDAVGIAGRQLAISRGNTTNPCSLAAASVQAALPAGMVAGNLRFSFALNGVQYGPYTGVSGSTCSSTSNTTGAAGNLVQGQNAQITVSYPCNLTVYGANYAPNCNLTTQVTELVQ